MSNSLAIAAVTATIRDLLNKTAQPLPNDPSADPDIADVTCSTKPPDKARTSEGQNQLNLFLFRTLPNAALRNMDMQQQVRPLESAMAPLALDLHYLVTAYGKNNDDVLAHRVLGRAMSILHDRAVLMPADIDNALKNKGADLSRQIERVRITPAPLTTEELSKLWAIFQTPYRVSAAYQVSVILLDSSHSSRASLPVLIPLSVTSGGMVPPVPTLTALNLPFEKQPSARLPMSGAPPVPGDTLSFLGHDLSGTQIVANFSHPLFTTPNTVNGSAATDTSFQVALPNDQVNWPAGIYTVSALVKRATGDRITNALALPIAPRIVSVTKSVVSSVTTLTVKTSPQIWPQQRASLIAGSVEYQSAAHNTKTDTLTFALPGIAPGKYPLRLRVSGVDSWIVQYDATPPAFDPNPALTVTIP